MTPGVRRFLEESGLLAIGALPYLLLGAALWGIVVGSRWLVLGSLTALGLMVLAVVVLAFVGAVTIPLAMFREWPKYTVAQRVVFGGLGVVLVLLTGAVVYALIALSVT